MTIGQNFIPDDVITNHILPCLDTKSLARMQQVSKEFDRLAGNHAVWQALFERSVLIHVPNGMAGKEAFKYSYFYNTDELRNKAMKLVKAVAKRPLTPEEATSLGVPGDFPAGPLAAFYKIYGAAMKLQAFYDVFKERIAQFNVDENCDEIGFYIAIAQKIIVDLSQSKTVVDENLAITLPIKIKTTLDNFNEIIFDDMVAAYANQFIADITTDSFKQKAALIKKVFPAIDNVDIEAKMRQAIKARFGAHISLFPSLLQL